MIKFCVFSRSTALAAGLLLVAGTSAAGVGGKAELGVLQTSGNSDTQSVNAAFVLTHTQGKWTNVFNAQALSASQDNEDTGENQTTAERYAAGFKSVYDFTEHDYLFGDVTWEKDLYGGVRERTTETVGYGRRLIAREAHKLDAEIGVGARQQETQAPESIRSSDAIGRAGLNYRWAISDTSEFSQTLLSEFGDANTYSESVTALKLSIVGPTFVKISYTIKNNSDVPADTENTDTFLAINLSYEFGEK